MVNAQLFEVEIRASNDGSLVLNGASQIKPSLTQPQQFHRRKSQDPIYDAGCFKVYTNQKSFLYHNYRVSIWHIQMLKGSSKCMKNFRFRCYPKWNDFGFYIFKNVMNLAHGISLTFFSFSVVAITYKEYIRNAKGWIVNVNSKWFYEMNYHSEMWKYISPKVVEIFKDLIFATLSSW